ncbi:MAG TPA: molybdopterin-binding protein [Candidatus Dormibacteraeota bacterium]|nr:molybdopterin-binding protein [Candidatus Dormibacteraeota bacterium]
MSGLRHGTVIIAVGDEVLGGFTADSNSHWLATRVREAGFPAERIEVVADRHEAIVAAIRRAVDDPRADRVVVSGGLGPTPDDITLEAVAAALGLRLDVHPAALAHVQGIVDRMSAAGWIAEPAISDANRKMTLAPAGAGILENRRGMASGIVVTLDGDRLLFVLPGVPRELQAIVAEEMIPRHFQGATAPAVTELRYTDVIEAEIAGPMRAVAVAFPDVTVGSYPQTDRRELIVRVSGADRERVAAAAAAVDALRLAQGAGGETPAPALS